MVLMAMPPSLAANFLPAFPLDDERNRDWTAKISPSFSQDEPISKLKGFVDRLGERGLSKTSCDFLRKAAVDSASSSPMPKVTAVPFEGVRCTSSKIMPDCSPSLQIDDDDIELSALQEECRACRVLTCVG
jgi:hypothetical protein